MNKFFYSLSLLLFFFLCEELRADTVITEIRTEQLVAPVGIDAPAPRLSWQITSTERNVMQTGYHILVSSSPEKLNKNEGDLWDSGKVQSEDSQWVPYAG